jgi:hypothetical protein
MRPGPCVEIVQRDFGFGEGTFEDGDDLQQVLARGDLGHDAAVAGVDGDLRGDDVRQHTLTVFDDGGGGLIA